MNAFHLRQLTVALTARSEIHFELEDGTRLEATTYRHAYEGATQDVVLTLRPLPKPEGEAQ